MLDKLEIEAAFSKIEALATAADYLYEPEEKELHQELVALIGFIARRAAKDLFTEEKRGAMNRQFFELRDEAESALNASKEAREVLSMWLDLIPCGDERESEALRVGVILNQINEVITHLEKAIALKEE